MIETPEFDEAEPLGVVRRWLRENVLRGGVICPCCGQHAQTYRRRVNSGMVRSMAVMWRARGLSWCYVPEVVGARSREEGKLRYWGLVTGDGDHRPDGGRTGWWRLTARGSAFLHGEVTIPKYAVVYNNQLLRLEGDPVTVDECVDNNFNLAALLRDSSVITSVEDTGSGWGHDEGVRSWR